MTKKILMIIAPTEFRDEEFFEPKKVFEDNNIEVDVASKTKGIAKGKLGAEFDVQMTIEEANPDDYDAVVFVGGGGSKVYFDDPTALKIAKDTFNSGKVIAAICIAPVVLANAGILKGKRATSYPSRKDQVAEAAEEYTGEDVTVDGKIVTGQGPDAATRFGEEIARLLQSK